MLHHSLILYSLITSNPGRFPSWRPSWLPLHPLPPRMSKAIVGGKGRQKGWEIRGMVALLSSDGHVRFDQVRPSFHSHDQPGVLGREPQKSVVGATCKRVPIILEFGQAKHPEKEDGPEKRRPRWIAQLLAPCVKRNVSKQ
jgi:hypothetical protein